MADKWQVANRIDFHFIPMSYRLFLNYNRNSVLLSPAAPVGQGERV